MVATGGLSIPGSAPPILATIMARQFGLPVVAPRPALVPLTFDEAAWAPFAQRRACRRRRRLSKQEPARKERSPS